jgi:CDP-glucose 4,6-dehydratase
MSSFWQHKNIFITGCSSFIGSWLSELLLYEGAHIVGLLRDIVPKTSLFRSKLNEKITIIEGTVDDCLLLERALNEYEIDTVFHLAAQTIVGAGHRNPLPTFETNIRGTWNVLEACRRNRSLVKRIIVASSVNAYGVQDTLPYTETSPLRGTYPYDVSKTCTDLIAYSYFNTYNLPVVITRCGNIYGGGDINFNRLIPGTIKSVFYHEPIIIRSSGAVKRDYCYVKDIVHAYLTLAENLEKLHLAGEAFNFSSGSQVSVLDVINKILEIMDQKDFPIKILNEAKGEMKDQYLSIEKAKKVLNWSPQYSLQDGLRETVEWYKDFFCSS